MAASQACTSITNVLLPLLLGKYLSLGDLGRIGSALAVTLTFAGFSRVTCLDILVMDGGVTRLAAAKRFVYRLTAMHGIVLTICAATIAGDTGVLVLGVAVGGSFALLQDLYRYVAFATASFGSALASDLIWLGIFGFTALTMILGRGGSAASTIVAWSLGAGLSGLYLFIRTRPHGHDDGQGEAWLERHRRRIVLYSLEYGLTVASGFAMVPILLARSGPLIAGQMRALQTLLGPLNALVTMLYLPMLRRFSRGTDRASDRRLILLGTSILAAAYFIWAILLVLTPVRWTENIIGGWRSLKPMMPALAAMLFVSAPAVALTTAVRVRSPELLLRMRVVASAIVVTISVLTIGTAGLRGYLYAMTLAQLVTIAVFLHMQRIK